MEAARELSINGSAVSSSIQALEEARGTLLFERINRGVIPTEAGARLYASIPSLLQRHLQRNARHTRSQWPAPTCCHSVCPEFRSYLDLAKAACVLLSHPGIDL
ncbi:LysR family transcriptional regulator [Noviherbaspirillum pedocola]|uniref:LysR family transcriptional regulator n=1 Tax=Noviherbaspirillum pedocola TaxID=2801341 RepID=A0A934SZF3_9BURK|nr:LysR family transcriptional regulator [Noviherbaspirillum pedocola]